MSSPGDAPDPLGGEHARPVHDEADGGPGGGHRGDAPEAGDAEDAGDAGDAGDSDDAGGESGPPGAAAGEAAPRRRRRRRRRRGDAAAQAAGDPARSPEPAGGRSSPPDPLPGPPREPARAEAGQDPARSQADRPTGSPARGERHRSGRGEPGGRSDGRTEPGGRSDGRTEPGGRSDGRTEPGGGSDTRAGRGGRGRDPREERGRGEVRDERGGRDARNERGRAEVRDARDARNDRGGRDPRDGRPARDGREPDAAHQARARPAEPAPAPAIAIATPGGGGGDGELERTPPSVRPERGEIKAPRSDESDLEATPAPIAWGTDEDGPATEVVLAPDLPDDAAPDDPDPVSYPLLETTSAPLGEDVASVAGVRFVAGGRIQWCDTGEADYAAGERVVVDSDRGIRLAWIAVAPSRKAVRDRSMRRVIRRASEQDLRGERAGDADRAHALRLAKDKAAALRLPLKVFRVELFGQLGRGAKLNVYYTSDERLDLRDFIRDLSSAIGGRIELRQLGVRDEAKAVGGIGSCGLTLCCTTWLPDFVPVSIKMAKDQGLVLSPTKVSGQCGRLKCCLVYEQAGYAELRKGLPKLGKRVIGARGEARVVEVDVLRQRVRVSYGPGDTEVVPASEVRPMFPSGNPPRAGGGDPGASEDADPADAHDAHDAHDGSDDAIDLPDGLPDGLSDALPGAHPDLPDDDPALPDDDPSSA
jgi:cell fate regulator YaaT (PSP1 superfamily)